VIDCGKLKVNCGKLQKWLWKTWGIFGGKLMFKIRIANFKFAQRPERIFLAKLPPMPAFGPILQN
jgi:hypothetical protein